MQVDRSRNLRPLFNTAGIVTWATADVLGNSGQWDFTVASEIATAGFVLNSIAITMNPQAYRWEKAVAVTGIAASIGMVGFGHVLQGINPDMGVLFENSSPAIAGLPFLASLAASGYRRLSRRI